jgi:hypothetical protein
MYCNILKSNVMKLTLHCRNKKINNKKLSFDTNLKQKVHQPPPQFKHATLQVRNRNDELSDFAKLLRNHTRHKCRYITGIHIFSNCVFRIRILTKITQLYIYCDVFPFETATGEYFMPHAHLISIPVESVVFEKIC